MLSLRRLFKVLESGANGPLARFSFGLCFETINSCTKPRCVGIGDYALVTARLPSLNHFALPPSRTQPYKPGMPDIVLTKKQLTDLDGGDLVSTSSHRLNMCVMP